MCSICVNGVSQRLKIGFIKWRKDQTGIYREWRDALDSKRTPMPCDKTNSLLAKAFIQRFVSVR